MELEFQLCCFSMKSCGVLLASTTSSFGTDGKKMVVGKASGESKDGSVNVTEKDVLDWTGTDHLHLSGSREAASAL